MVYDFYEILIAVRTNVCQYLIQKPQSDRLWVTPLIEANGHYYFSIIYRIVDNVYLNIYVLKIYVSNKLY